MFASCVPDGKKVEWGDLLPWQRMFVLGSAFGIDMREECPVRLFLIVLDMTLDIFYDDSHLGEETCAHELSHIVIHIISIII